MNLNRFYTINELSKVSGIAKNVLQSAIDNGELKPVYFGEKQGVKKISTKEFNRWADVIQQKATMV